MIMTIEIMTQGRSIEMQIKMLINPKKNDQFRDLIPKQMIRLGDLIQMKIIKFDNTPTYEWSNLKKWLDLTNKWSGAIVQSKHKKDKTTDMIQMQKPWDHAINNP